MALFWNYSSKWSKAFIKGETVCLLGVYDNDIYLFAGSVINGRTITESNMCYRYSIRENTWYSSPLNCRVSDHVTSLAI